jgi:predicted RNase H-like HicB family nuclease
MENDIYIHPLKQGSTMRSYIFRVVFEKDKWPDEPEEKAIWRAYIPVLPNAHAWGNTEQEAFENLKNAVDLVIEDLQESGQEIPLDSSVQVSDEPLLTVTI